MNLMSVNGSVTCASSTDMKSCVHDNDWPHSVFHTNDGRDNTCTPGTQVTSPAQDVTAAKFWVTHSVAIWLSGNARVHNVVTIHRVPLEQ